MNKNEIANKAVENHGNRHNCCQSVACALSEFSNLNKEDLYKLGAGFAGGMGDTKGVCGALVGAVMVLGQATDGNGTVFKARELSQRFNELSGAIICRDLKGADTGMLLCSCDDCIRNAATAFCEVMNID